MTLPRARRMDLVKPNAVGELLRMGSDPSITSFAGGYPDASLFPLHDLNAAFGEAVTAQGRSSMQYTVSDGPPAFREQIAARMRSRGVTCTADDVLVLQGSQQGLDLVAKLMIDPGDVVITESPTFLGVLIAFNPMQPRYAGVRLGPEGMDMDHLEEVLKKNPKAKLLYTIPDFQNPTGATMSLAGRKRLIELANKYNLVVLEDTAYREVRFEGEAPPTIKSMDKEGRVILLGSFSKILAPGLRLGWAVASGELIQQLGLLKLAADTQCSTVNMNAVSLYLQRFDIDAHIATLRKAYRRKKDLMLETARRHFPQEARFTDPEGGLFTWATLPASINTEDFMRKHALPEAKVAYVPGASFFPEIVEHHHMRLNYSGQPDEKIAEGMAALGKVLKAELARKG